MFLSSGSAIIDFHYSTSPSLYLVVNTLRATNNCGKLGPTFKNEVVPMDLTDVSTITMVESGGKLHSTPAPLTLADIASNCSEFHETLSTDGAVPLTGKYTDNGWNRCNPRVFPPMQFKRLG